MSATKPERLPEWADEWLGGSCGCGARLVLVHDYTGARRTVCAKSGWDTDRCNRPAVTTTEARDEAHRLLRLALHLRMNGERAPGGTETWRDFDAPCERYLRALDDATPGVSS